MTLSQNEAPSLFLSHLSLFPEQKYQTNRNETTAEIVFWCVLNWKKINSANINWIYVYCSLSLLSPTICLSSSSSSVSSHSPGLVFSPTTYSVGPHSEHRAGHHVLQDAYIANIHRDVFLIIVVSLPTEDGDTLHEIKMDDVRIIWNLFFRGKTRKN